MRPLLAFIHLRKMTRPKAVLCIEGTAVKSPAALGQRRPSQTEARRLGGAYFSVALGLEVLGLAAQPARHMLFGHEGVVV
jgi:hypothetical protein